MSLPVSEIFNQGLVIHEGFPYPDWKSIGVWAREHIDESNMLEFWESISNLWIEKIRERIGEGTECDESERVSLISKEDQEWCEKFLDFAERSISLIQTKLNGIAKFEGYGKHLILLMPDWDSYYQYVSYFYPEGSEYASTAGMCIYRGYCHTILGPQPLGSLQSTLLHELTHCCLRHLRLAQWLDESLAQVVEVAARFSHAFQMDQESFDEHMDYWNEETIQDFWSGKSFQQPDLPQKLSYQLSEILYNIILKDVAKDWETFAGFASNAHWKDAGNQAAKDFFGEPIGEILSIFLGEGDWDPKPDLFPSTEKDKTPPAA